MGNLILYSSIIIFVIIVLHFLIANDLCVLTNFRETPGNSNQQIC